ncbi:hypothetical protein X474_23595 [Dethiosulfatarculus sandiegensis]|uniref:Uncharacterized protein n=1 Tax=Dethiosulfatarculus sandiegensis TaxID=1429043 RepID=A0A0D2JPY3_9BACT|nr:hypothetical protein X474_23595 [Dethiosulfatarculus sandiegensis]
MAFDMGLCQSYSPIKTLSGKCLRDKSQGLVLRFKTFFKASFFMTWSGRHLSLSKDKVDLNLL